MTVRAVSHRRDITGLEEALQARAASWVADLGLVREVQVITTLKQEER